MKCYSGRLSFLSLDSLALSRQIKTSYLCTNSHMAYAAVVVNNIFQLCLKTNENSVIRIRLIDICIYLYVYTIYFINTFSVNIK